MKLTSKFLALRVLNFLLFIEVTSLNDYLLSQRDLLVLMDNYLGESEVVIEYFDIKNEIINTVHLC